mmetsp:Transcript_27945/g.59601  ORF Transcript_27945/g.59601 Transcript_27945/m.59601 type:complete len:562 (-) Transcript_27945:143-1828(-)
MANEASNPNISAEVFLYTGEGGARVPDDVVRVRVDPSVTAIPEDAFRNREKLEEVELCEGLREIGERAFINCIRLKRIRIPSTVMVINSHAFCSCFQMAEVELCEGIQEIREFAFSNCNVLKHVNIPATVKRINDSAFVRASLLSIHLPDGMESIGDQAFFQGGFPNFRNPPLITTIPKAMLCYCVRMFSLELSDSIRQIKTSAFTGCKFLRNVAIPPNAEIEEGVFYDCTDLEQLFGSRAEIHRELKIRFNNLPIHKMIYYQSYHPVTLDQVNKATNTRSGQRRILRSRLNPTGKEPDCLGMTPLHILACSTKQDLALYQILIEKYPENLIAEDRWEALPIFYAIWGNAPSEIMQFLVESHQSVYPDHKLNWSKMVETVGIAGAPLDVIQNLLDVQQTSFPEQRIDWDELLDNLAGPAETFDHFASQETFRFLTNCGFSKRLHAIGVKKWRNDITNEIHSAESVYRFNNSAFLAKIRTVMANREDEYHKLKEATSTLELALWKAKINESNCICQSQGRKRRKKKTKMDATGFRRQCRMLCGASLVVENVMPFLLPLASLR